MKKIFLLILFLGLNSISNSQPVWFQQNSGTANDLNCINFRHAEFLKVDLYVCGDNGIILKSVNDGFIWTNLNSGTTADLNSITVYSNDTGFAVGESGIILRTTNGGISWNQMASGTSNSYNCVYIYAENPMKAYAVGDNGTFSKYANNIWTTSQIDSVNLNSVLGGNNIYIAGNNGTLLRSTNSGVNWFKLNSSTVHNLNEIGDFWTIVGDSGTVLSVSGDSVINLVSGSLENLNSNTRYEFNLACGDNGTILKDWQKLMTNTNQNLNSIKSFYGKVWTVGDNGTISYSNSIRWSNIFKQLNSNNISAWFNNNGKFNNYPGSIIGFEWPKGQNLYARYASGLQLGAIVQGDTLVSVCIYSSEYLPGQTVSGIPTGNGTPEFRNYRIVYGENNTDRNEWPNALLGNSDQGAPVYFDHSAQTYKPVDYGNQTMFYSYTDSYVKSHIVNAGSTAPLKADIKQINFSFDQPEDLKDIIYQEFRIINRSNSQWSNAYINLFTDDDLGIATDDAEGVDTNYRLSYTYNFTNTDGDYGINPPAVGFAVIRSPLTYTGNISDTVFYCEGKNKRIKTGVTESRLNSTAIYHDDSFQPVNYRATYNALRGLKNDGSEYINPVTNQPTKFVYSGDPEAGSGWLPQYSGDMRFYQGFGPLNMNPGDTQVIVIAQVIARGTSNTNSVTKLKALSQTAKQYYDNCFEGIVIGINNNSQSIPGKFTLHPNYPNPFNPRTIINYELGITNFVKLIVYDVLGNEVATLVNEKQNAGSYKIEFDGSNFASGVYFYRIKAGNYIDTKRMMLLK